MNILIKESKFNKSAYSVKTYTGLPSKEVYYSIIGDAMGQILDGIGEGDDKKCRMFRKRFETLVNSIDVEDIDGELVICSRCEEDTELLTFLIWSVAKFEREDNEWDTKDHVYHYLGSSSWRDICVLNNSIKKAIENNGGSPWSEEKRNVALKRLDDEKERAIAELEAKKSAKDEEKIQFYNKLEQALQNIKPDATDIKRAEDAWNRTIPKTIEYGGSLYNFTKKLISQLDSMKDEKKKSRRVVAFYKKALEMEDEICSRGQSYKYAYDISIDWLEEVVVQNC